ncbi:MAG: hypothetical protein H0X17_15970 [Deltaproteobacteria bacterium]|nr:hypothetical protein [Deltaproteobacteria bacterium]
MSRGLVLALLVGLLPSLVIGCTAEDKHQVETKTESAVEKVREGAIGAKDKAKELASKARDRLRPQLEELDVKIVKATKDLASASSDAAKQAAKDVLDRLREEKLGLEKRFREP